jgi:hypothetical protein
MAYFAGLIDKMKKHNPLFVRIFMTHFLPPTFHLYTCVRTAQQQSM